VAEIQEGFFLTGVLKIPYVNHPSLVPTGDDIGTYFDRYYKCIPIIQTGGGSTLTKRIYEIRVEGLLGDNWMSWFEGLTLRHLECGQTVLTGLLDQAMLRGILTRISDLGLNLVSVQQLEKNKKETST
jgi:hypothetical protein